MIRSYVEIVKKVIAVQYDGTNIQEVLDFCPRCSKCVSGRLYFDRNGNKDCFDGVSVGSFIVFDGYKHLVMTEHEFNNNYTVSNVVEN